MEVSVEIRAMSKNKSKKSSTLEVRGSFFRSTFDVRSSRLVVGCWLLVAGSWLLVPG